MMEGMFMETVCEPNLCNGCNACVSLCSQNAITLIDSVEYLNAVIDEALCIQCNACTSVCPRNNLQYECLNPIEWHQGWATDDAVRRKSASGGAASAIMKAFIAKGGYVCSCTFTEGEFAYYITNNSDEVIRFAGSKYVKSDPQKIYREVKNHLHNNRAVLFVGLPCHVAAIKNYVGSANQDLLYTVDLICHGTPSVNVLKKYLSDHGYILEDISDIRFRAKNDFRILKDYKPIVRPGIADRYLYTFLKKINYTENCYECQFAKTERISDITVGDSWGSTLPNSEKEKGISLFLVQTEKGKRLLEQANLVLEPVDVEKAINNNGQLKAPANMPIEREAFMKLFKQNKNFDHIVFRLAPSVFVKQNIKQILYRLLNVTGRGITYIIMIRKE